MIHDTTPIPGVWIYSMRQQAKKALRRGLFSYFAEMAPHEYEDGDIDNLIEQATALVDEVLAAYEKVKEKAHA